MVIKNGLNLRQHDPNSEWGVDEKGILYHKNKNEGWVSTNKPAKMQSSKKRQK